MKNLFTTLLVTIAIGGSAFAQQGSAPAVQLPANFNPWSLQAQYDQSQLEKAVPSNGEKIQHFTKRAGLKRADGAEVDTVQYFTAIQTYRKNYVFSYTEGEIRTYNVGIARDGNKVSFSNLFNLYDPTSWSPNHENVIEGTYDEANKTITIPSKTNFNEATVVGDIYGYYVATLVSGTVNSEGTLTAADELVFHVEGDFESIWTEQAFGIMEYSQNGENNYGQYIMYRRFTATAPTEDGKLIAFNSAYEFGETFPNTPVSKTYTLINTGSNTIDYAITIDADDDAYTANPAGGGVEGLSTQEVTFTFSGTNTGNYEGIAQVDYESGSQETTPLIVQLNGDVIPFPDYSPIVKSGDFEFTTNIEAPFEVVTLDDGTTVARSTTHGQANISSKLNVDFTVPEGKLGHFSYKGKSFNTGQFYSNAGGVIIDDAYPAYASYTDSESVIDNELVLAPGAHRVTFQYDGYYYTGTDDSHMYVYDLMLDNQETKADSAVVVTESHDFGNFVLNEGTAGGTAELVLENHGTNPLSVIAVTADNECFTGTLPAYSAGTMEQISVPVTFTATTAGTFEGVYTIETSAGTFTVPVKAFVREMPDFSQIVTEGLEYLTFSVNEAHPFIIEDGKARNASAGEVDNEPVSSWFQINFTIPEGKLGYISWEGHSYGEEPAPDWSNYGSIDYSLFDVSHPMNSGTKQAWGDSDAGSAAVFESDEAWANFVNCIPGDHSVRFQYNQVGNGTSTEMDRLEVWNIKLHVIDFLEDNAELLTPEVTFDSTYVGPQRYTTATVTVRNTGSNDLKINGYTRSSEDSPFYGVETTYNTAFNNTIQLTLWFFPTEPGTYEDVITINTTGGDLPVQVKGVAKDSEGIVLIGDFEDQAYAWSAYDLDGDGENWDLGFNMFGGHHPEWVHGDNECMGSGSWGYSGALAPDNWLISPTFLVPEDGAVLRWYAGAHHHTRYAENYSVYIAEPYEIQEPTQLTSLTPIFSETLTEEAADVWQEHVFNLDEYANKDVCLLFRHHDCTGQYLLKIDDAFVYTHSKWDNLDTGVDAINADSSASVVSQEIYDLQGRRVNSLVNGVNIIRSVMSDGSVVAKKVIVK